MAYKIDVNFTLEPMLLWWIMLAVFLICGVIEMIALFMFYRIRFLPIIKKRFPNLILVEAIFVIMITVIALPWCLYSVLISYDYFHLAVSFFAFLSFGCFFLEISRIWLLSFALHRINYSQNEEWKTEIDENYLDKNWYLKHKDSFGNEGYVGTMCLILYIVWVTCFGLFSFYLWMFMPLSVAFVFVASAIAHIVLPNGMMIIFLIVTYVKCRKYNVLRDGLLFFYEIKMTIILFFSSFVVYALISVLFYFWSNEFTLTGRLFSAALSLISTSMLSTAIIPVKLILMNAKRARLSVLNDLEREDSTTFRMVYTALADEKLFAELIKHTYQEINQESALSFIELLQFKQQIIQDLGLKRLGDKGSNTTKSQQQQEEEEAMVSYSTRFLQLSYPNIPKSTIVFKERPGMSLNEKHRAIAHELFERYLRVGCVYQLNIASEELCEFKRIDAANWNLDNYALVEAFDHCLEVQIDFMAQSYQRYLMKESAKEMRWKRQQNKK